MTVSRVGSPDGTNAASATSISKARSSNVVAGNLIVVCFDRGAGVTHTMVAADCTQSAGTAVLGTITLDVTREWSTGAPGNTFQAVAIFSAIVTTGGSLTMQVANQPTASFMNIGINEYSTTTTWNSSRTVSTNSTFSATGSAPNPGNASSTGPAAFIGVFDSNTGSGSFTVTPKSGWAAIFTDGDATNFELGGSEDNIVSGSTTDNGVWASPTTEPWVACIAVEQPTAAAGGEEVLFEARGSMMMSQP